MKLRLMGTKPFFFLREEKILLTNSFVRTEIREVKNLLAQLGCHCDWVMWESSGEKFLCLVQEHSDGYRMSLVKNVLAAPQGHVQWHGRATGTFHFNF